MEGTEDDEDLKLIQASVGLLSDLQDALPKILWRSNAAGGEHGPVHAQVRQRDLDYAIRLIEPFQGEPQLLDTRLKHIVPPIVAAHLAYLQTHDGPRPKKHLPLDQAACTLLYTLCKVRGYKVIVGFFNNEARYLESIVAALERNVASKQDSERQSPWQVDYILLLWLSHLLLTPFDLATISDKNPPNASTPSLQLLAKLPPLATRCLQVGMHFSSSSTKAQDAASAMLVRLAIRPDMQKLQLGEPLVEHALRSLQQDDQAMQVTIYHRLGPLRFLAGIATSADLSELIPNMYQTCLQLLDVEDSALASNAVAKKLTVKIFRNIVLLSLRSASTGGALLSFLDSSSVLEDVIDYLLRSLGDRDTPVRYAAAKAMSLIIQELDSGMGHEVIQAILDMFKQDLPRQTNKLDFRAADPLKWHGLTLALAHTLFKRTASPEQLPDIVIALVAALQFEQRTTTGSSLGTNVRDAANFGIWSLSRRYTTDELSAVSTKELHFGSDQTSVIQAVAIQLILSACLDPAGNIRRGSSAALQELIGRHPNKVYEGISLVQIVDYQAVGLRKRGMVHVAARAAEMHGMYWTTLVGGVLGWRGIGSPDVLSRHAAAASLTALSRLTSASTSDAVAKQIVLQYDDTINGDVETLHGLVLALAGIVRADSRVDNQQMWAVVERLPTSLASFSARTIQSELPAAAAQLIAALCSLARKSSSAQLSVPFETLETLTERLLARQEDSILHHIPDLARALLALKWQSEHALGCISAQMLCKKVAADSVKSTLGGAGRAIALGALAPMYDRGLQGDKASLAIDTLAALANAPSVDWRVVGSKALQLTIEGAAEAHVDQSIMQTITRAIHVSMNDYTVDERGDVGSLVRTQAIVCASDVLPFITRTEHVDHRDLLHADVARLSMEKLDRVRLQAAQCRALYLDFGVRGDDLASVSNYGYFYNALTPLREHRRFSALQTAVLEGAMSSAGTGAEPLLVVSRAALCDRMTAVDDSTLQTHMSTFAELLKDLGINGGNTHPALSLLAFLLDMQIPQRLLESGYKWRNLLSNVQKSHHKSNDIPRILAAVNVYRGLAEIPTIRDEVAKKLISMLRTNPYPRVRVSVAETLFSITTDASLKERDWSQPPAQNADVVAALQKRFIAR
ncbi:hypothetical protein LTR86_001680 [Recurvomyces mirabilis]|nr:hypothetical protein LTR86_001680 [Recurvomyces mirabilis]